jgi:hypothetical protein
MIGILIYTFCLLIAILLMYRAERKHQEIRYYNILDLANSNEHTLLDTKRELNLQEQETERLSNLVRVLRSNERRLKAELKKHYPLKPKYTKKTVFDKT